MYDIVHVCICVCCNSWQLCVHDAPARAVWNESPRASGVVLTDTTTHTQNTTCTKQSTLSVHVTHASSL